MVIIYQAFIIRNFKMCCDILENMVIRIAVLPRVDQLTKAMPNFWRAVYSQMIGNILGFFLAYFQQVTQMLLTIFENLTTILTKIPNDLDANFFLKETCFTLLCIMFHSARGKAFPVRSHFVRQLLISKLNGIHETHEIKIMPLYFTGKTCIALLHWWLVL